MPPEVHSLHQKRLMSIDCNECFQIIDDMLDVEGDDKKVGKPGHLDEQNGKNTFVTVYGMDKCRDMAKELTTKALDYANMFGQNGPLLKDLALWLLKRDH